jgi:hypothetical protein
MKCLRRILIFILIPVGFIISLELRAADKYDILINDDNSSTEQSRPRVAVGYSGEIIVIWADKRSGRGEIYYQILDSTGTPLGLNQKISGLTTSAPQFEPSINANLFGQFASVWKDYRNGSYPFNPDTYYAGLSDEGSGTNYAVSSDRADSTCESPDVAVLPDGNIIVVWADYRNREWDIYGQRLNSVGEMIGNNFKINSDIEKNQQHSPRVAALSDGGFSVVWYDNRNGNDDIYSRIYSPGGIPTGSDFRLNDDNSGKRQVYPAVAGDGNQRFFVAWVDWRNGVYPKNSDIYFRRYNANGLPIGSSEMINPSGGEESQKDVAICADRMGNLGITWADSSTGQWNAMARIVDCEGVIELSSFLIHDEINGRQLQPDIATDGYKFFFTWADSRNGDFDIYLTIREYNDPTIMANPNALQFEMEEGGVLPSPVTAALSNAGYGELNWDTRSAADWITVTPPSGLTPANIQVSINTDTLSYGEYVSEIRLIDLDNQDSTETISVVLSVTAPIIDINPDTLRFKALAELGNPDPMAFRIDNAGSGELSWTAEENADWLSINPLTGSTADLLEVSVDIYGLQYGQYTEPIMVNSPEAVNSPETSWVSLELVGNMSYIKANPDTLIFKGNSLSTFEGSIEIANLGSGTLDWTAVSTGDWLVPDRFTGSDYDTINVTVLTNTLNSGYHRADIIITDEASFNQEVVVPVKLYLSSGDTIQFSNANAMPGSPLVMPLSLLLSGPVKAGYIPFTYDTAVGTLDSIIPHAINFPDYAQFHSAIFNGTAEIGFRIEESMFHSADIPQGNYELATLFFTAGDSDIFSTVDTLFSDTATVYILNASLTKNIPAIIPGNLIVGNPTTIPDIISDNVPCRIELKQNYPNPFNAETTIELFLPGASVVSIDIFNILGQRVRDLFNGHLTQGPQRIVWDGKLDNHMEAPSGIYFYRLAADRFTDVRKMVLIK